MARPAASEEDKLYKIGEVCKLADLQPYVLRYWETEFPQLAPGKSGGGQRLYTRAEVDIILRIKELLYKEGFTTAGAKKKLEQEMTAPASTPPANLDLTQIKSELRAILAMLDQ
jgi:DNA-binding transcriptional MerR regulator